MSDQPTTQNPEPLNLMIKLERFGSRWRWTISEAVEHKNVWWSERGCGTEMTREEAIAAANARYNRLQADAVKRREEVARITQQFDQESAQWAAKGKHE